MNQKLEARAFERVRPMLQPGEQPVAATRAQVGRFQSGRLSAVVKVGSPPRALLAPRSR
ncbi:MAG: hypothetical protein IRY85_01910 [Micromonosporaceae bacterium]|nr:hypothetical protein [Micromonosporaceae bacterium]